MRAMLLELEFWQCQVLYGCCNMQFYATRPPPHAENSQDDMPMVQLCALALVSQSRWEEGESGIGWGRRVDEGWEWGSICDSRYINILSAFPALVS